MKKPRCPLCKKAKDVINETIPVRQINGKIGSMQAYLCERCALLFIAELSFKTYIGLKQ